MTPGWTTATWLSVSISRISFIRSNDTRIPSGLGTDAPESPVPLPRATTGIRFSSATRRTRGHLGGATRCDDGQRDDRSRRQRLVVRVVVVDLRSGQDIVPSHGLGQLIDEVPHGDSSVAADSSHPTA